MVKNKRIEEKKRVLLKNVSHETFKKRKKIYYKVSHETFTF